MSVMKITNENFNREVMEYNGTVLLDFWATWCGPCRMIAPVIDEVAVENPDVKVGKINVDEESELTMQFGIKNIPTLIVVKNGNIVTKQIGAVSKEEIVGMLKM